MADMKRVLSITVLIAVTVTVAGCGGTQHHTTTGPPPVIDGPVAKPYHSTLLLHVVNANHVRVCFDISAVYSEGKQVRPATTRCNTAQLLKTLPSSYPGQKNLLTVFHNSVWSVQLPAQADPHSLKGTITADRGTLKTSTKFTLNSASAAG